jgi:hypothetical protein
MGTCGFLLSYLDQPIPLGVEELEDLLEVLHLILGESLVLGRHFNFKCH